MCCDNLSRHGTDAAIYIRRLCAAFCRLWGFRGATSGSDCRGGGGGTSISPAHEAESFGACCEYDGGMGCRDAMVVCCGRCTYVATNRYGEYGNSRW